MFDEVIPARTLNALYIWLDIAFLLFFLGLLIYRKKYMTVIVALLAGVLYFIVDYGIFYHALGTRTVTGANTFWFLLWLSMSYGITNFAWIWLWLNRDSRLLEWSLLIVAWWIACPLISQNFGAATTQISISRGTGSYHGVMALIMFVGYAILCVMNLRTSDKSKRINILWLLIIGILVQFAWEFSLLITGIRNPGFGPLIVNSLIETNLGLPYMFFIHRALTTHLTETLKRKTPKPPEPLPNPISTPEKTVINPAPETPIN